MSHPITVQKRNTKQSLTALRAKGSIPGILYGQSLANSISIEIALKDLQTLITVTSNSTIFPLQLGEETCDCILREYQTDSLCSEILHVDFQVVKKGEIVKMSIPVTYEGLDYLKNKKLIIEKSIDKLAVKGPVQNLPQTFIVDVGALDKGAKIFAQTVTLSPNTELLIHPETIIATVQ
ncbi:MAG: 50S ribosomal protein L25 [Cellulosilyticaceae bacterium]